MNALGAQQTAGGHGQFSARGTGQTKDRRVHSHRRQRTQPFLTICWAGRIIGDQSYLRVHGDEEAMDGPSVRPRRPVSGEAMTSTSPLARGCSTRRLMSAFARAASPTPRQEMVREGSAGDRG